MGRVLWRGSKKTRRTRICCQGCHCCHEKRLIHDNPYHDPELALIHQEQQSPCEVRSVLFRKAIQGSGVKLCCEISAMESFNTTKVRRTCCPMFCQCCRGTCCPGFCECCRSQCCPMFAMLCKKETMNARRDMWSSQQRMSDARRECCSPVFSVQTHSREVCAEAAGPQI